MNQKNKIEDNIYLIQQHQSREGSGIGEDDAGEDDVDEEDGDDDEDDNDAQWFRKAENRDVNTGPFAQPFASLLARSHRSLICLLRTARFARALRCAHSFPGSLTHSLPSSWESE